MLLLLVSLIDVATKAHLISEIITNGPTKTSDIHLLNFLVKFQAHCLLSLDFGLVHTCDVESNSLLFIVLHNKVVRDQAPVCFSLIKVHAIVESHILLLPRLHNFHVWFDHVDQHLFVYRW